MATTVPAWEQAIRPGGVLELGKVATVASVLETALAAAHAKAAAGAGSR
jgi:hypothetical protein